MSLDIYLNKTTTVNVHKQNITHNLSSMAKQLGIYDFLWGEQERSAGDMIKPLNIAIRLLNKNIDHYKKWDAENGWGTAEDFLLWLEELLGACIDNPSAEISVSK